MDDRLFMLEAIALAKEAAEHGDVPVGAVVVKDGKIIGRGKNRREEQKNAIAHAEILAIEEACAASGDWRLSGCVLYVTLEPCPMCSGAIVNSRMDRVVYGAPDAKMGAMGGLFSIPDIVGSTSIEISGGVLEEECRELLDSFFKSRREENSALRNASRRLMREFYTRDVLEVAPALLGKLLCRRNRESGEIFKCRITETEAYRGTDDTACHASKGKTPRTAVMWDKGGSVYVYLCYGMHIMLNVVSGEKGSPEAVLVRGVEGADGPGKLTKMLGIEKSMYGADLVFSDELWIEDDGYVPAQICTSPRIGIDYAETADREREWRYYIPKKN
jgi:DNA-3-methyladenine glycosylase